ncbi:MAG TPA: hypothetical protein VG722_05340, partial [Tepidisphaeraceae bacterium]|nr:hypothetical protein [Tepidisphaeraceae bacterium]
MPLSAPAALSPDPGIDHPIPFWKRRWFLALILLALTITVYWQVVGFKFIDWDDWQLLSENKDFSPVNWSHIGGYWLHGYTELYAPLSYTLWAAIAWVEQYLTHRIALSPGVFHLANLLVHLAASQIVFLLLYRLLDRGWPALVGAIVFALHPLQVEA